MALRDQVCSDSLLVGGLKSAAGVSSAERWPPSPGLPDLRTCLRVCPAQNAGVALALRLRCYFSKEALCVGSPSSLFLRTRDPRVREEVLLGERSQPERAELKCASWCRALSQAGPTWRQPGDHGGSAEHMCAICPRSLGLPGTANRLLHLPGPCWSQPHTARSLSRLPLPPSSPGVTSCFSRCAAHLCRGCCVCLPAHPGNQTCT